MQEDELCVSSDASALKFYICPWVGKTVDLNNPLPRSIIILCDRPLVLKMDIGQVLSMIIHEKDELADF